MWLNKSILFATAILIVSILLFSSQTTATNCKTVTKTRHYTETIHPKNCPKTKTTTVTVKTTTIKPTTATTTTTTTTTTTSTVVPTTNTVNKRHENKEVICIPDKKEKRHNFYHNKHEKCVKTVYCTPTVIKKCPKPRTKTLTATRTFTSTSVSVTTTTATVTTSTTTVIPCCTPGAFQTTLPLQLHLNTNAELNEASNPTSCCVACALNPDCVQWNLTGTRCFLSRQSTCNNPVVPFGSAAVAGGIMRCQDGCLPPN